MVCGRLLNMASKMANLMEISDNSDPFFDALATIAGLHGTGARILIGEGSA